MSGVFSKPKIVQVQPQQVQPEVADSNEMLEDITKKRKKRMGAVSQLLSRGDNKSAGEYKTTLGA